ncbi:ATP-binding protein [Pendulispora albinea]|uniref:histidine kinase n=1 Tax=Pendulispora albinea TaxID=2741071 RepID=A0ABZ2LUC4_9BACT
MSLPGDRSSPRPTFNAEDTLGSEMEDAPPTSRDPLLPLGSTPDVSSAAAEPVHVIGLDTTPEPGSITLAGQAGKASPVGQVSPVSQVTRGSDSGVHLEELVARESLSELCASFFALFGIPVRVYSSEGALLADASREHEICAYMGSLPRAGALCTATVSAAKSHDPELEGAADVTHACFTGNVYRILGIDYDGRRIGRLILGPYLPAAVTEVPPSLLHADPDIVPLRARSLLNKVPRAKDEAVTRMANHLKCALDLILWSGHKAMLTSQMHLSSVRESYRELEEKTRRLQEAYDRLRELDRLKSSFLATVSHELRTPLTSIIGYSEMLTEGIAGELAGEQKEFVLTIHDKGEQLLALITSLLDLSKLESGSLNIQLVPSSVRGLFDAVVSTLSPSARRKSIELSIDVDPEVRELKADAERLRQVFVNLVDNAIKFTPSGGKVRLFARNLGVDSRDPDVTGFALLAPAQMRVELRVTDTGIGIPATERARVFDAFYQVDSSSTREYGGTGLGLSIVKRLVDAHGGTIHIEDNVPQGTVFVVRLPSANG